MSGKIDELLQHVKDNETPVDNHDDDAPAELETGNTVIISYLLLSTFISAGQALWARKRPRAHSHMPRIIMTNLYILSLYLRLSYITWLTFIMQDAVMNSPFGDEIICEPDESSGLVERMRKAPGLIQNRWPESVLLSSSSLSASLIFLHRGCPSGCGILGCTSVALWAKMQ